MPAADFLAVWRGGRLSDARGVDPGLLSGLGVFETLLVMQGRTFALDRHLGRLRAGAERLGLPPPSQTEVEDAVAELSSAGSALAYGRLRLTWTPGVNGHGHLLGTIAAYRPATSAAVHLSQFQRNHNSGITGVKATSYAENLVALAEAKKHGADEAILANCRGELCEGTTSNVFIEQHGELLTPTLESGCLPGITRELCLEWGRRAGIPIREDTLPFSVMNTTSHLAITSALKGVIPVHAVDGRATETGPLTRQLSDLYTRNRDRFPGAGRQ